MALQITAREGEFVLVRGTAMLSFARVSGRKVALQVYGPGRCLRQKLVQRMLTAPQYERLIAGLAGGARTRRPRSRAG